MKKNEKPEAGVKFINKKKSVTNTLVSLHTFTRDEANEATNGNKLIGHVKEH